MSTIARHLTTTPTPAEKREEILAAPGFGRFFTDHMVRAVYDCTVGESSPWQAAELVPYAPLQLDPSTSVAAASAADPSKNVCRRCFTAAARARWRGTRGAYT